MQIKLDTKSQQLNKITHKIINKIMVAHFNVVRWIMNIKKSHLGCKDIIKHVYTL